VSTRLAGRPEGKLLFDPLSAGDTFVVRWVDRLGRNFTDVVDATREFMRHGVRHALLYKRLGWRFVEGEVFVEQPRQGRAFQPSLTPSIDAH
jgi:hypothetical protein